MAKYYGVTCKTKGCGAVLALGLYNEGTKQEATPLEPLRCPTCQKEARYGSDDIYYFEATEDVPLIPVRGRVG